MVDFAMKLQEAFESRDPERVLDVFSDDARILVEGIDQPLGKQEIGAFMGPALESLEDVKLDVRKTVQKGREVAMLVDARVTFARDYEAGGLSIPTAGKSVEAMAALFVTLDDEGRAKEMVRVRDNWQIMRQMGLSGQEIEELMDQVEGMLGGTGDAQGQRHAV